MTNDADDLVCVAQKQLDEHKAWLAAEVEKAAATVPLVDPLVVLLTHQVGQIRLRVAKVAGKVASVVYEYPDELYAFLRSEHAPEHLRAALAGGLVVDPNQPTLSVKRTVE